MNSFKDFNIKPIIDNFTGDKIKISKILDKEITVVDYKIGPSNFEGKGPRLDLQIQRGDELNVVFTGAKYLMQAIEKVPKDKFPFKTTIIRNNESFQFT